MSKMFDLGEYDDKLLSDGSLSFFSSGTTFGAFGACFDHPGWSGAADVSFEC